MKIEVGGGDSQRNVEAGLGSVSGLGSMILTGNS